MTWVAGRAGKLRAYDNGIVGQLAAQFVEAYMKGCD
jgi:hypothetical protein